MLPYPTLAEKIPDSVQRVVTAKTQCKIQNAREYFEEHLCVGDYYDEGQRVAGEWFGLGAERLGLSGKVRADDFLRLCENQHPVSGDTLTARLNTTRTEGGDHAMRVTPHARRYDELAVAQTLPIAVRSQGQCFVRGKLVMC